VSPTLGVVTPFFTEDFGVGCERRSRRLAHPEQRQFIKLAIAKIANYGRIHRIIEIGSYDVNGEIRSLFRDEPVDLYVGVDLIEGPGVDVVSPGHEAPVKSATFDLAISVECFEHDQFWIQTFKKMVDVVKPGGWIVFTCASKGRPEHGTSRSDPRLSPGTSTLGSEYYRNLTAADFSSAIDLNALFGNYQFVANHEVFDLYFIGRLVGSEVTSSTEPLVSQNDVKTIHDATSKVHLVIRLPLRVLSRILPEAAFQAFAFRYWKYLNAAQERLLGSRFSRS
jgi:SAM-dependent methyltransferase